MGGEIGEQLIRVLKDSGFNNYKGSPSNEYKHNRGHITAIVGKDNVGAVVHLSNYTPNTHRFLGSTSFDNPKKLAEYFDKNQIYSKGGSTYQGGGELPDFLLDTDLDSYKTEMVNINTIRVNGQEYGWRSKPTKESTLESGWVKKSGSTYQGGGEIVGSYTTKSKAEQMKKSFENSRSAKDNNYSFYVKKDTNSQTELKYDLMRVKGGSTYQGGGEIYSTLDTTKKEAEKNAKETKITSMKDL